MIISPVILALTNTNYIAGSSDGIVTVQGRPASREISLLDAVTLAVLKETTSRADGHYVFVNLDADREYLVMVRDYKKEFEPFAWDYVKPATDLDTDKLKAVL